MKFTLPPVAALLLALPVLADFPVHFNTEPDTDSAPMPEQQRDPLAYLMHKSQVPLPDGK